MAELPIQEDWWKKLSDYVTEKRTNAIPPNEGGLDVPKLAQSIVVPKDATAAGQMFASNPLASTISSGPQEFAAKIIESLKRDPRMLDWFNKTFAKQEAVSTLGNPVMGFHGRTTDYPLEEIRGGTNHVIDQVLGPHMTVDPKVAAQFALHKGYGIGNLPQDFEGKLIKWLKEAQDTGYGYNAVPGADKVTYGGMGAYKPEGGNIIPAFLKSEKPRIIKQGWRPTEWMPAPTPMISKGNETTKINPEIAQNAPNTWQELLKLDPTLKPPERIMNDASAIQRDFFQTLFQDSPRQRSLGRAEEWFSGQSPSGYKKFDAAETGRIHDRGELGQHISNDYVSKKPDDDVVKHFVDKYKGDLRREGYDSIMYHNTVEAPRNLDPRSFIMIEPNNIISPFDFEKLRRMGGR